MKKGNAITFLIRKATHSVISLPGMTKGVLGSGGKFEEALCHGTTWAGVDVRSPEKGRNEDGKWKFDTWCNVPGFQLQLLPWYENVRMIWNMMWKYRHDSKLPLTASSRILHVFNPLIHFWILNPSHVMVYLWFSTGLFFTCRGLWFYRHKCRVSFTFHGWFMFVCGFMCHLR